MAKITRANERSHFAKAEFAIDVTTPCLWPNWISAVKWNHFLLACMSAFIRDSNEICIME